MARNNGRDGIPRIGRPDHTAPTPESDETRSDLSTDTGPVDIAAVRRDDEFIEAIRGDGPVATDDADEYQLALLLSSWRAEITEPALPAGPDLDDVAAAVDREIAAVGLRRTASGRKRSSFLRPVAGAAAAIAVVMGGLVVFSYDSAPGDPLWSVKSVVFSEQAESTVAQIDTTSMLEQAENMIANGDVDGARALIDGAAQSSGAITDQMQRSDVEVWMQRLREQVQPVLPSIPPVPELPPLEQWLPELGTIAPELQPDTILPSEVQLPAPVPTSVVPPPLPLPSLPTLPLPTQVPVTPTTGATPTDMLQPNPTTATANGSATGGSSQQSRVDTPENGG